MNSTGCIYTFILTHICATIIIKEKYAMNREGARGRTGESKGSSDTIIFKLHFKKKNKKC